MTTACLSHKEQVCWSALLERKLFCLNCSFIVNCAHLAAGLGLGLGELKYFQSNKLSDGSDDTQQHTNQLRNQKVQR